MQLLANTTSPFVRIARIALIEKGLEIEPTIVDPWADDARLRTANAEARVPTLVLDDGTPLSECLLIVQWLEAMRSAPSWPSLCSARIRRGCGAHGRPSQAACPAWRRASAGSQILLRGGREVGHQHAQRCLPRGLAARAQVHAPQGPIV